MGLLFGNYLEEGFYEKDSYGTFTKLTNYKDILKAQQNNNLYENDGVATTYVDKDADISYKSIKQNENEN
jgi:hypothetical protein